jgi:predicted DNA binding CopG/RHH family protein
MKQPKLSDLVIDPEGTKEIRSGMKRAKKIKITVNVDEDSLTRLRKISDQTGIPYQTLLNRILKDGLSQRFEAESRLDRIERDLRKIKRKIAA